MTNFLPNISRLLKPAKVTFCIFALARTLGAQAQADLQISDLLLTPGNEHGFDFSYSITNAGNQSVASYQVKLTFSKDAVLDASDYYAIEFAAGTADLQVAGGQSLSKSVHFETNAVNKLLPSGTWTIIAEVNADHTVVEANYANNKAVSASTIHVDAYTAQFLTAPTIGSIMNNSFVLSYTIDGHIYHSYYRYQFENGPAPSVDDMRASAELLPDAPVTISYLSPAQKYDVYFMGEAKDGNITEIYKVPVTTSGSSSPSVITVDDQITLSPVEVGIESWSNALTVYGHHLTSAVVVRTSEGFVASLDDITYASEITVPAASFSGGAQQQVLVKSKAFDSRGQKIGTCTVSAVGATDQTVNLKVVVFSGYNADFESATLDEAGWLSYSVSGEQSWTLTNKDGSGFVEINGAEGTIAANEDWLISPQMDLSTFTQTPALRFRAFSDGDGEVLKLKYSENYPGYGDPRSATWFDATASFPSVNSKAWRNVMVKILDQDAHIRFAFVYTSTDSKASHWMIDDWNITDNPVNIPGDNLVFEDVSVGKASDPKTMPVSVGGFGSVTITASADFQVSSDGVVYSPAIVVPESEITTGITLRVRCFPKEFAEEKHGSLTFTSNGGLSVVREILTGRMGLTTAVENRIAMNGFLYPNPTDGEVHIDLSTLPGDNTMYPVMVANSIGVSLAMLQASSYTIENSLSDIFYKLEPGVYFVIIKGPTTTWRTKLIRK
ncbi:MAG: choice-of-anchor J domain-containing protein [Chryseolinea sp.]